jgi:hypothetical protein
LRPFISPELRYRRFWFGVGILIAVGVAVLCLVPGRNLPSLRSSDKLEHLLAFAMLAFWFGSIVIRRDPWWLVLALLAFGGLIELAQGAMHLGREAEWGDFLADAGGVALGLLLSWTPLGGWTRLIESRLGGSRP